MREGTVARFAEAQTNPVYGTRLSVRRTEIYPPFGCGETTGWGVKLTMAQVIVKPGEPLDAALKRFKKQLQQDGTLKLARAHEYYEKPSDKRRKAEAARRRKMKQQEER
jgi:small subunit ribosomal protein S21